MKRNSFFSSISIKKFVSAFLIASLLVSQTIHVSFFDRATAGPENYHDIVSIIVDSNTYRTQRTQINRYAQDITGYLGGTRTSIMVVSPGTSASLIAAKNEKLYYEGDGDDGVSSLVGTILIGDIPIPMVSKNGTSFPSLFPYLDFVDKAFVYDKDQASYIYNTTDGSTNQAVEIWHGVINPAVGREWNPSTDIPKIGQFLDKTHEFYAKSGKFTPNNIPPKVFYYDGYSESKSVTEKSLFQYSLNIRNAENIAYNRFTKYLLQDVSHAIDAFDKSKEDPDTKSFYTSLGMSQGNDTFSDDLIRKTPDIQTRELTLSFLKNFKEIFNEKTLGEELAAVHNAGRYNSGSRVAADLAPISITLMDEVARSAIKTANDGLQKAIDNSVLAHAAKIPIFDNKVLRVSVSSDGMNRYEQSHKSYYFGTLGSSIVQPSQCTIARGASGVVSAFGRGVLAEANSGFDVNTTEGHIDILKKDTDELVRFGGAGCFTTNPSGANTKSYWGNNSILRLSVTQDQKDASDFLFDPPTRTDLSGFSLPVFSLGGMKESSRVTNPSIGDCLSPQYQYTLQQPYTYTYSCGDENSKQTCTVVWPSEWQRGSWGYVATTSPRFTCNTQHVIGQPISLSKSLADYAVSRGCLDGSVYLDGVPVKTVRGMCITTTGGGDSSQTVDNNIYESRYYHTIPSVWSHVSPTDDEIIAATQNGTTPSLAVDQIRFVEFMTPKGNIAHIEYPNFFNLEGTDIASVRTWLRSLSERQWKTIIDKENSTTLDPYTQEAQSKLGGSALPSSPIDWNQYISDDTINKVLQSKNWLHPDVAQKYRQAIPSLLSYSRQFGSTDANKIPPLVPTTTPEYEIAYLGMPRKIGLDFSQSMTDNSIVAAYDTGVREIEAANISEDIKQSGGMDTSPESECGPPDGVPLWEWPRAIICWINKQLPPKILAGSCGPTTIGLSSDRLPTKSPSIDTITNTGAITEFYSGARLVPHLDRSSLGLNDTIDIQFTLVKGDDRLMPLTDTTASLELVSGTIDTKVIVPQNLRDYLTITPDQVVPSEKGTSFIVESRGQSATIVLRAKYDMTLSDGSTLTLKSAEFPVRITPEHYSLLIDQSGSVAGIIDTTNPEPAWLRLDKVLKDGFRSTASNPVFLNIVDDISGATVYSGASFDPKTNSLPIEVTKKVGVYRLIVKDQEGIMGETTFAVRAGPLSQIRVLPLSSALVKGEKNLATLRLLDRLGNQISPELHSLKVDISGGYIVDGEGQKRTTMTMDVMESQIPVLIGSDAAGTLRVTVTSEAGISSTADITVYEMAKIVLSRQGNPQIDRGAIPVKLEIQDAGGKRISGLSSVASWTLPDGAGVFSKDTITITDGASEPFTYIPGTVSGDHHLTITIPGIGTLSDIIFSVKPGVPMYINHSRENNQLTFNLRDRYGNLSDQSLTGKLTRNSDPTREISFTAGAYRMALQSGYYLIDVPTLSSNSISYTDAGSTHSIFGIPKYAAYITLDAGVTDFAPDYNARYTVLAGDSFLREGEDILYNTTPSNSQSLAVSTILDTPYSEDVVLSVSPGGSYHMADASDMAMQASVTLHRGYPLLTITDLTSQQRVAQLYYRMASAILESCEKDTQNPCNTPTKKATIRITTPKGTNYTSKVTAGVLSVFNGNVPVASIGNDGSITLMPSITLTPRDTQDFGLQMSIKQDGDEIAILTYITDIQRSVERSEMITDTLPLNTPILIGSSLSTRQASYGYFSGGVYGYQVLKPTQAEALNTEKNGPNHTDDLGSLSEVPGIGWQGNNTMLLAYAGGDTVGEATKFFHTYTLINLGDPVTHVDHGRLGTEIDGIDRSVGSVVARGTRAGIVASYHRDMNADGLDDLIVLYRDGYMELFLNLKGKFRSRGMITHIPDMSAPSISFGDFIHDGYADIVGLDAQGNLILIDNTERRLTRKDIVLDGGAPVPRHITQMKVYDMDADEKDDIVYLTAGGELGILYGTQAGQFTKKVLDAALGISLSTDPITIGGAITATDRIPQLKNIGTSPTSSTTLDDTQLKAEAFYNLPTSVASEAKEVDPAILSQSLSSIADAKTLAAYNNILSGQTPLGTTIPTDVQSSFDQLAADDAQNIKETTFIKTQYATAYNIDVEKRYTNSSHATLYPDDRIVASIRIKNTGNTMLKNIQYLDTIPQIFSSEKTETYTITINEKTITRDFQYLQNGEYDALFGPMELSPGETLTLRYELTALPASYGEMVVGDMETGTVGADIFGDVGFKTSTTCGANMLLWTSGPTAREYMRGTREFGSATLPEGVASQITDLDHDGVPDSMQLSYTTDPSGKKIIDQSKSLSTAQNWKSKIPNQSIKGNQSLLSIQGDLAGGQIDIGFDAASAQKIESMTQDLMNGLSCGFGGGSCMSFPLNWAPLAPGSDPVIMGFPIGDGLKANEGIPIFSALTTLYTPYGPYPVVWPPIPNGAGGYLGEIAPFSSSVRIFVTPTLTLGMGTAICLGSYPSIVGNIPPPALSPFIQGGNCIVMAKPMNVCKGDGSVTDGDVSVISGLGRVTSTWNANSCDMKANTITKDEDKNLTRDIVEYLRSPNPSRLTPIYTQLGRRGSTPLIGGPLLTVGSNANSSGGELSIEIDSNTKISDLGNVIKLKNKRISAFPDFIMDWLTRQTEEITSSLFTPPNLTIIPPTDFGQNAQVDSSYEGFWKNLGNAYSQTTADNIASAMTTTKTDTLATAAKTPSSGGITSTAQSSITSTKANLNAIKTAYTMIGKLPFINIRQVTIPINIPWISKGELDRYGRTLQAYKEEVEQAGKNWCVTDQSQECLDKKAKLQSSGFIASINRNLQRIEEYKRFPQKLQKYITWKDGYIAQILCNIDTIQQLTTGWVRDNGIRFRKWAELFVLLKAIAASWQPLLDIFAKTNATCGVCRNERYNSQYFKFKLLSMLIPSIPVIKFPKWPDIILDLSDVRLGINVAMPNFDPRLSPIRLPDLPSLSLGSPSLSLNLPALDDLLPPLPPLPDLPDLPSLPRIKLPDLPPPPKVPKLAGVLQIGVTIMKLISKMYCFYQKTMLIPEWQAGDVIAQRTERQGTLSMDFLDIQLPQFSLPSIKEIRVSTHVNFELRADFIAEFARAAVKPINQFKTDLQMGIPSKIAPDIAIPNQDIKLKLDSFNFDTDIGTGAVAQILESIEKDKDALLDVDAFKTVIMDNMTDPVLVQARYNLKKELATVALESQQVEKDIISYNANKWNLLRSYLKLENDNNAHLQGIIDLISNDHSMEAHKLVADHNTSVSRAQGALDRYNSFQKQTIAPKVVDTDHGLNQTKIALESRLARLASVTTSSRSNTNSTLAAGYAPKYTGIYIQTPISKTQTRLFDYTSPVTDITTVDTIDIDKDGDQDYIYILNDILYVKYSHLKEPDKISDSNIKVTELGPNDLDPYVPNYFASDVSTTQNINFSFRPTDPAERQWRLDFYDRYIEWDEERAGNHKPEFSPMTTVDLFATDNALTGQGLGGVQRARVDRVLMQVNDQKSFILQGRTINTHSGKLSLSISPGRTLYTSNSSVRINLKYTASSIQKQVTLEANSAYTFSEAVEITTDTDTRLYSIGSESNASTTYTDDLIGLPILPGMQVYSDAGVKIRDVTNNQDINISKNTTYRTYDLGSVADSYNASFYYPDGFYYGRLYSLLPQKTDRTQVVLFAPQKVNDTGAPVIDLPSNIRIPIYTKQSYLIADVLTDLNGAHVDIDGDVSQDSNNNSTFDDDFSSSGTGFSVTDTEIRFGPFDTPGIYNIMIRATDTLGNIATMPISVEAYTPVPTIDTMSATGWIMGSLSTSDSLEPIHFFRVRPSSEPPILINTGSTLTTDGGKFASGSFFQDPETINLTTNNLRATITNHGIFTLPVGTHIEIEPMTRIQPMRIVFINQKGGIDFVHVLSVPESARILDLSDPVNATSTGVLVNPINVRLIPAKSDDPTIPNGAYIVSRSYVALAGISQNGNISLLDPGLTLQYREKDGYLMIEIRRGAEVLAEVNYRIEFFYTMK